MKSGECLPPTPQGTEIASPMRQPGRMHAVTGPEYLAPRNPFMTLRDVVIAARPFLLHCRSETALTSNAPSNKSAVWRITGNLPKALRRGSRPATGNQSDLRAFRRQGGQRAFDKALRAPVRVVALPDNGNFHDSSSALMASRTVSAGMATKQSLTLPEPQPSSPHGRQL